MVKFRQVTVDDIRRLNRNDSILLKNKYFQCIHYRVDDVKPFHVNDAGKRFIFMKNVDRCSRFPDCFSESDLLEYEIAV